MSTESPLLTYLQTSSPSFRKARLAALYSDFSTLRTLNPDGYAANLCSWISVLSSAALAGVLPSSSPLLLTLDESLYSALETKEWGRPLALGTVAQEAIARREWMDLRGFESSRESIYRSRWRVPSVGDVLGWGLRQLGFVGKVDGKVVLLGNLEAAARTFEARTKVLRGRTERVWSLRAFKDTFRDLVGEKGLTDSDFEILLSFLGRDKGLVSWEGETVKLRAQGESAGVTAEDATIANLKTLITVLETQTKSLEARVDELGITARQAVEKKNRVAALVALRSKKLAEGQLGKRHATLAQLEEVFVSIEQAADQVELVNIMEGSTRVLEGLNKEVGGTKRVDDVVDNLREQMEQVEEVGGIIAEAGETDVDEGEVDDELEAMELEENQKFREVEKKEREERERKEAEERRKKLAELEEVERTAKENAEPEKRKEAEDVPMLLRKLSLDPEKVMA